MYCVGVIVVGDALGDVVIPFAVGATVLGAAVGAGVHGMPVHTCLARSAGCQVKETTARAQGIGSNLAAGTGFWL
jgi:hypothetical protein